MSSKETKSFKLGRDSKDGRFTTVEHAREHPNDHQVEHVPKKGHGDTDRKDK